MIDPDFGPLVEALQTCRCMHGLNPLKTSLEEGLLYIFDNVCVPKGEPRLKLMREAHRCIVFR